MPKNNCHTGNTKAPLWVSQNYLTGRNEIRRLIGLADIRKNDHLLEIGPGKGHITRELLERCGRVTAVELDAALCVRLRERFAGDGRLTLIEGDFLRTPLPEGEYKVFANIPFSATSAIIKRLTQCGRPPRAAWLIMEWGAARRFCGGGLGGCLLRPYFRVRTAAKVPRESFHPSPRVDGALLELRRRENPDIPWERQGQYRAFMERAFRDGPRSLLTNRQIAAALRLSGLPAAGRDGNMEYVQWLCLFRCWQKFHQ